MFKYIILVCIVVTGCGRPQKINSNEIPKADHTLIIDHLTRITKTEGYRNYQNRPLLNRTAGYILSVFQQYADTAWLQSYAVDDNIYHNVVCRFGTSSKPIIVVGAHYDVCGDQEGADDNASGVTGLLELARLLKNSSPVHPIELVAYSLEEPPFFRTPYMGSYIHAKSLHDQKTDVYGMLVLEMIGFYNDEKGSQNYPLKPMKVAYGTKGDFILLAKRSGSGPFVNRFSDVFNHTAELPVKQIKAPAKMQGIDFSDHLNYWHFGYDALMITNTAFYRNQNYHRTTDTMETLDISRMASVIDGVYQALLEISNEKYPEKKRLKKLRNKATGVAI